MKRVELASNSGCQSNLGHLATYSIELQNYLIGTCRKIQGTNVNNSIVKIKCFLMGTVSVVLVAVEHIPLLVEFLPLHHVVCRLK